MSRPGATGVSLPAQLPNLVIVGVAKAGTTSLFRYLAQHPTVCGGDLKELRYFSALRYGEPLAPLDSYARNFQHCAGHRYRMEATPGYYPGGQPVAEAMNTTLPDARIVVSFRDPVQRCWSWFRFVRSTARIPKDMSFDQYLDRCERLHAEGIDGHREHQPFWALGGGCYDQWIDSWLDVFGQRLRIEFFEDVVADPKAVTADLCGWLGIDTDVCANFRYDIENKTVQYKNKQMQQFALSLNRHGERFFGAHPALKRAIRSSYYRLNSEDSLLRMEPPAQERLSAFYAPHNERLAAKLAAAGRAGGPTWLTRHYSA